METKAKFDVWYMKPEFFRDGTGGVRWLRKRGLLPATADLAATHVKLRSVEADNLEQVFRVMQGEIWSPNGEARDLIRRLGLQHTSMSVGDIAVDAAGTAHIVDSFGFEPLA
jgi:hypothetical protein